MFDRLTKNLVKYVTIIGIAFILGMIVGEQTGYKKIVDDCRILQASRLGERVIKCNTV
jgi:hypothetical protein